MRKLVPCLLLLIPLLPSAAADPWIEDSVSAGEADVYTIWNPGCDLLWFWTLTFELVDPALGDSVSFTVETTDSPFVGGGVASWTSPVVVMRGSGSICALLVEVAGLSVVGSRTYRIDFELATLPDQ